MAAKYWYVANNGNSNWNTSGAWYDVPGGPPNGGVAIGVPTINDEAYLDGESGSGTLTIVAGSVCYSLDCTNFTGTLAGGSAFQVAGNFFLSPSMTFTHFGTLTLGSVSYPGSYVMLQLMVQVLIGSFMISKQFLPPQSLSQAELLTHLPTHILNIVLNVVYLSQPVQELDICGQIHITLKIGI